MQLGIGTASFVEVFKGLSFSDIGGGTGTALTVDNTTGSDFTDTWTDHTYGANIGTSINVAGSTDTLTLTLENFSGANSDEGSENEDVPMSREVVWNQNVLWEGDDGSEPTRWDIAANWSSNSIPASSTSVTIPSGPANQPVVSNGDATVKSVTIDSGATLTLNGSRTLTVQESLVNNGTFTANASSTVVYAGTLTTVSPVNYGNLTISSTDTATLSGNTLVQGDVTISSGANLNGSSFTLTVNGSWVDSNAGGDGFVSATSTVSMATSASETISATTFYNLTIDAGTKTLSGDITVNNDLTVTSTGTLDGSNRGVTLKHDYINQHATVGGFTPGTSTVTMACSGTRYIALTATSGAFNNITFGSGCTAVVTDSVGGSSATARTLDVGGTLTIGNGGALDANGDTITVEENWSNLGGTFTSTSSSVTFDGSSTQQVSAESFNNVTVDKGGGTLTTSGGMSVGGTVAVDNGTLNLGSGLTHSVTGAFTLASPSGTATLNTGTSTLILLNNFTSGSGGTLTMNGATTIRFADSSTVTVGGDFSASGTTPMITKTIAGAGGFGFTISGGTLNIAALIFEYASNAGFNVQSGVTSVTDIDNLTLRNMQGANVDCIQFNEPGDYDFSGFFFDGTCSGTGDNNVATTLTGGNSILMSDYSGAGSGAGFESDPNSIVTWTNTNTWTGGLSAVWSADSNWSRGSAPTTTDNVVIDTVTTQPSNVDVSSTFASLDIRANSTLTQGLNAGTDLTVTGDCVINTDGSLIMGTNVTSDVSCGGNFTNSGTFTQNASTGYLRLTGAGGTLNLATGTIRRIEIASGATYTLGTNLTFSSTDNFDVVGTLNASSFMLTTSLLNVTGTFNADSGEVVWQGTALPTGVTYHDLTIDSGTATISGTLTVTGDLTINNGATLTTSGNAVDVTGNLTVATGGTLAAGASAISVGGSVDVQGTGIVSGTSTLTLGTASSDTLAVAGGASYTGNSIINDTSNTATLSGSVSLAADFENRGTLVVGANTLTLSGGADFNNNGGTANLTNASASISCGDFTNGATATLTFGSSTGSLTLSGAYDDSGTVTVGLSTVTLTGGSSTIVTPGSSDFYNLVVSGTRTASNGLDVENNVTIGASGSFTAGAFTHTVAGNWDNQGGTFVEAGSTVTFDGSGAQSVSSEGFVALTVNKSGGTLTASGALTLTGALTVTAGTFDLGSGLSHSGTTASVTGTLNMGTGSTVLSMSGNVTVNSSGTLRMQNAPVTLRLANGTDLSVSSGGSFVASGSGGNIPTVESTTGNSHGFDVFGSVDITGMDHDRPDADGIHIRSGATIVAFSNITHSNNTTTYVRVANLTYTDTWNGHVFNGSVGNNVTTDSGGSGTITMTAATGTRAGESFDADTGITVDWPTGISWVGGTSTDWGTAANWSSNPSLPGANDTVTIPASASNQPVLDQNRSVGNITIETGGGTLDLAGFRLTLSGSMTNSGSVTHNNGELLLNGTGAQSVDMGSSALYDVDVNKSSGTASVTGNLVVNNDVVLTAGTLDLGSGTHAISGVLDLNGGTLNVSTSTTTVTGALTLNGGSTTLDLSQNSGALTVGSLTSEENATITFASSSASLTVNGSFINSANFTPGSGTLTLAGTGGTLTTGLESFYDLVVSGTYSSTDNADINNDLTVSGSWDMGSQSRQHDVAGDITVQNGGDMDLESSQATLSGTGRTITVDSGGQLTMRNNSRLRIGSGGTVSISGTYRAVTTSGLPTVRNNGSGTFSFTINSGGTLNVSGLSFSNADANGLQVSAGATIVDLDDATFASVASGGTHLRLLVTSGTFNFFRLHLRQLIWSWQR